MSIVTLDFETFYGKDYTLSSMTTEEYVRDPRFETIGVSVKVDDAPAVWFSGTKTETKKFLDGYNLHTHTCIAHNALFDMSILSWRFDIRPKRIVDTLSMARALHGAEVGVGLAKLVKHYGLGEKGTEVVQAFGKNRADFSPRELSGYGDYCCNDTELTRKLFDIMGKGFPLNEFKLIDMTVRMFTEPVLELDKAKLDAHAANVAERKAKLLDSIPEDLSTIMSSNMLADALRARGIEPPTKVSTSTDKETYAFAKSDEEFLDLLDHPDLEVQALVAARLGLKSTLEETRTARLRNIADRGKLPVPLRYYAAHTGRWGGEDKINLQNIPRVSPLKYALRAPPGYRLVDCDSSQIEARILAWLAEQDDLTDAFARGEDVYRIMASSIYGKLPADIDKSERFVGKTTILGCGYGMGGVRFKKQLKNSTPSVNIDEDEAKRIVYTYRDTYSAIPDLWKQGQAALMAMVGDRTVPLGRDGILYVEGVNGIRLPNGLYQRYPNLRWEEDDKTGELGFVYDTYKGKTAVRTKIYGGKLVENVSQALARIVIGEQMIEVAKRYRPTMTVHDAIGAIAPVEDIEACRAYVVRCMKARPAWAPDLPLNCESAFGLSYGDCSDKS